MFSPTGYVAIYTLKPSNLPYKMPVVSFNDDGQACVVDRSGQVRPWCHPSVTIGLSDAEPRHVLPTGERP